MCMCVYYRRCVRALFCVSVPLTSLARIYACNTVAIHVLHISEQMSASTASIEICQLMNLNRMVVHKHKQSKQKYEEKEGKNQTTSESGERRIKEEEEGGRNKLKTTTTTKT